MSALAYRERPAAGDPAGLLILHHGRGSDEHDLLGLADAYDPQRRLHVVTPRGPLTLPGAPGAHWYVVPRVGYPDPQTFHAAVRALAAFHDETWARTGLTPAQTILGGFSMGAVMSYSLGLHPDRPAPAGILAHSGFLPTVEGWAPELASRATLPVLLTHGRADPIMDVAFARQALSLLEAGGLPAELIETGSAHAIDPEQAAAATQWIATRLTEFGQQLGSARPRARPIAGDPMPTEAELAQYTADWRRWIAENLVREVPAEQIVAVIIEAGVDPETAQRAVEQAQAHPYIQGALVAVRGRGDE